ncbi:DUF2079 domain-containing protein [Actinomyces bouchesdurhonensis]|uniref:DUF2079 domain-containing protein n=1 Tax=Actinomyces bouchesdurhonensis TaxID=1852361 RepID=UPI0028E9AE53|nr:DUF2079 domain-containing protein [Actinomyces bouchesdurhonensis]
MKRPDRLVVGRVVATWWLPVVVACAVGGLYVCLSLGQWRALVAPSWDLGIFAEAVQAYSRFEAPIVPIKGPGYNLLGDHFHPILALLGPVYRLFPSALTLLVVQDVLIAVSVLPVARLAQRLFGRGGAVIVGLGYGLGWGLQGAVGAQFHEVCVAVPLLAFGGVAFVEHRWGACMGWLAPLVLVKEDLGLTVFMAGLALAWRGRGEGRPAVLRGLAYALFGIVAFVVTVKVLLPAMNPAGTWAYSLDGAATGAGTPMDGSTAARGLPSLWDILTTPSVKLATLLVLLAGAGFVGSASPWFALVLPTLAWRFAGSVESYYVWDSWHYNAVLVPIAACSLLDVMSQWLAPECAAAETGADSEDEAPASSTRRWRVAAWAVACVPAVSLALTASFLPLWKLPTLVESPRMAAAQGALNVVPAGTSVETDTTLLARLVPGRDVYWVGTTVGMDTPPEYVVVDRQSYAWGGAEVDAESWASAAHPGHTYETVYAEAGFRVARRTS